MKVLTLAIAAALYLGTAAHASIIIYDATLSGPNEFPPVASPGIGSAVVTVDTIAQTMEVSVKFSSLLGPTTASHIHCCTAAPFVGTANVATQVPTFTGFPLGVTNGTYDHTFDLTLASTYNPAFVTATVAAAEALLLAGMASGNTYLNIHTMVNPGGEISGFLAPAPEPGTLLIAGMAVAGLVIRRRFWRR
jgi:hypothetical protein